MADGGHVVDVRPAGDYAAGHIPGSLSIPLRDLAGLAPARDGPAGLRHRRGPGPERDRRAGTQDRLRAARRLPSGRHDRLAR
ncbi:rhodanese-like domain-containing protein [Streptomyces violaceochromogenes]|uniref:Rhodanese-like domain-containing protein n=1 Tax=Streptomyces violaceochromogenes TaxID=67377 RepID=A0ABU6LMY4_9ACTN|nr:rhodanese-like domain-containing protein [Streptomyces violaceochromogenes]MEC7050733.1 rhodanese-like domain-containing protein [Streptomyces violaceochromogenes]